ncbi:MAG: MATE family efflux transporter [Proteobacteria bacterium]|nr:MATE family efflux transporter [Pseudomonadota bacterium]
MDKSEEKALLLGREKVSKLLWKFSLPAIAAMVVSSIYNVIAGIFIAHLGAYSIAGVGLTAPFMNLAAAFGALVGVGASVLCSMFLGEKNYDKARQVLCNLIVLNFFIGILFSVIGLIWLDPILLFFGASENTLAPAHEYMQIILYGNVFAHMYLGLNSVLRVSGYPVLAMSLTFVSVAINIILAPIFIFALDMGVRGAAWATVISQVICCMTLLYIFSQKNRIVHIETSKFRPDWGLIRKSFVLGSPNFCTNAVACFIVVIKNSNFLEYGGDLYVGAYSIVNRVVFFFLMITLGFSQGMQPIVAYNYGAKQYGRMWQALRMTIICATVVCVLGCLTCELFPRQLTEMFVDGSSELDTTLIDITINGFRIAMAGFWCVAVQVIGANFFSSIDQAYKSLFLSLTRQMIFIFPMLLLLPPIMGVNGVWITDPVSDIAAAICAGSMIYYEYRKQKKNALI